MTTPQALSRSAGASFLVLLSSFCLLSLLALASAAAPPPPPVRTGAPIGGVTLTPGTSYPRPARGGDADVLGTWVARDPYRWMEDPEAAATKEFVAAENNLTSAVLDSLPLRTPLKTAMAAAYNYEKWGIPFKAGGRYFYRRNAGLKNQPILYSRPSLDGPPSVVLDPNVLRADGTVALQEYSISHDGAYLAAAFSTGGSDWRTVRVFRVGGGGSEEGAGGDETPSSSSSSATASTTAGRPLPETLSHVKFTELSWTRDSKGFFYSRYDPPLGVGGESGTSNAADSVQQLWYHVVGTPQSRDARVFSASAPTDFLTATATGDGEHLILSAESTQSASKSRLLVAKISALPRDPVSGALDLSRYDLSAPAKAAASAAAAAAAAAVASKAKLGAQNDDGPSSAASSVSVASIQAAESEEEAESSEVAVKSLAVAAAAAADASSPSSPSSSLSSTLTTTSSSSSSSSSSPSATSDTPIPFPWISLPTHGGYEFRYVAGFGSKLYFMTTFNAARYRVVRIDASAPTRGGGGAGSGLDYSSLSSPPSSSTPSTTATWVEVVAEDSRDLLQSASPSIGPDGKPALLLTYLHDVKGALRLVKAADGSKIADIPLPGPGAVSASSDRDSSEIFFKFASFTNPGTVYRFDAAQPKTLPTIWKTSPIHGVDLSAFSTTQVFVPSADGRANIPLFITAKKGLELDGTHPAVLYGYGGFNIVNGVEFQPDVLVAAQAFGSVYASCGMRGGGEYGERWHADGVVANKQNTYDDFVSCAEYLVKAGYTSPARLSIHGASFGGTLVATVANQRPDLFACVLCDVPVTDIARFHKVRRSVLSFFLFFSALSLSLSLLSSLFSLSLPSVLSPSPPYVLSLSLPSVLCRDAHSATQKQKTIKKIQFTVGVFWKSDYGDPELATERPFIQAWSPLHNIAVPTAGTRNYPAILVSTAEFDDRVPPLHSLKYAATLQHDLASNSTDPQRNALLLRVETQAGHGGGKPMAKHIADATDKWSFCMAAAGAGWVGPAASAAAEAAERAAARPSEEEVAARAAAAAAVGGDVVDLLG